MTSARAELALAIRVVNLAYSKLTPEQQEGVEIVIDDDLEAALLEGVPAVEQITDWRDRQLGAIGRAAR